MSARRGGGESGALIELRLGKEIISLDERHAILAEQAVVLRGRVRGCAVRRDDAGDVCEVVDHLGLVQQRPGHARVVLQRLEFDPQSAVQQASHGDSVALEIQGHVVQVHHRAASAGAAAAKEDLCAGGEACKEACARRGGAEAAAHPCCASGP